MIELTIIVPVFNSEECLEELASEVSRHVSLRYELILVNDCSSDNSWNEILRLTKTDNRILGISLRKNAGQDNAIMAGLRAARGHYIAIMDDDLQHSPSDLIALYDKCHEGFDICYANFEKQHHKQWNRVGSWFNGKLANILFHKPDHIYLSPFKIIKGDLAKDICSYSGPYPYVDGLLLMYTDNITQIDIAHHKRYLGKSNYSLSRSFSVWTKHLTGFSVLPLRIASLLGVAFSFVGLLLALYYLTIYFTDEAPVAGWTTIVCINLILGGVTLFCLGITGEYIGRTYLNLNKKPQYSISKTTNEQACSQKLTQEN